MLKTEITHTSGGFNKGDIVSFCDDEQGDMIISKITSQATLTIREIRWYDRLKWAVMRFIKDFVRGLLQEFKP